MLITLHVSYQAMVFKGATGNSQSFMAPPFVGAEEFVLVTFGIHFSLCKLVLVKTDNYMHMLG